MGRVPRWIVLGLLNAALSAAIQIGAPSAADQSDRNKYEYVGENLYTPECFKARSLYCYRVLIPATLKLIPADPEIRWQVYRWAATTTAGTITSLTSGAITGSVQGAIAAAILVQASYGFAFTAYDPYSPDPAVFAFLAAMAWCWMHDRWLMAGVLGLIGMFAKETVVLMSAATALAALLPPRRINWKGWMAQGAVIVAVLLVHRWAMATYLGWRPSSSGSLIQIDLNQGGWLALWLEGNPPLTRVYLIFVTFAFAWLYAVPGFGMVSSVWKTLAIGSALPFLALNYVQNPERALGNIFFILIPLAAMTLSRVPMGVAIAAALLSGGITARAGSSNAWLPSTAYVLVPAAIAAGAVAWSLYRRPRQHAAS